MSLPTSTLLPFHNKTVDMILSSEDHEVSPTSNMKVDEEAPANALGAGKIAGAGIGPDGEPGVRKTKYKKANELDNTNLFRRAVKI